MAAIKRDPMPPGPISELFDRLHELHLSAGLPSMREIAAGIGRGVISSSTIHNMFRGSRVPRWSFLELVVEQLHGDPAEFLALWQAAVVAEEAIGMPGESPPEAGPPAPEAADYASRPLRRIWSDGIPPRNPHFIGRTAELGALRANLAPRTGSQHPPIQVISGLGGIGKTAIATQFVHLYRDRYEVICWIHAEHLDRVREALVRLGRRLDLRLAATDGSRDRAISAVLRTLESGRVPSWLLVYDNAIEPLDLQQYLPACLPEGHIIITSRLKIWPSYIDADNIEVLPFSEEEAVSFLRHRVPALAAKGRLREDVDAQRARDASRLAATLRHLPIAIELAAAYLAETGQSAEEYLTRFGNDARQLVSEQPTDFPVPVSAALAVAATVLTTDAGHLFSLCAFFSPEPIAADLLLQNAHAVMEPLGLREVLLSSHRFRSAGSQLHRLSLARVDGARDLIQVHRVVQAVTEGRLRRHSPDTFRAYRAAADTLLAESNPGNPDRAGNDAIYDLSLQHLQADRRFFNTGNAALRRLVIDQVRRLHLRGGHVEAMRFGEDALRVWRERLSPDHLDVLTLAVEVAIAMRLDGHAADASRVTLETLMRLRQRYGDDHEIALLCANTYGADLRTRGQFGEALELDLELLPKFERVFGPDHGRTLNVLNNIGADYRRLGSFREALEYDKRTFEERRRILGDANPRTLHSLDAVARDLRGLGLYQESLDTARKVVRAFAAAGGRENPDWLNARKAFAVALRKAGHHWDAFQESEEVVQRYRDYLGPDHTYTLRAATNLINDRRAVGDLIRAAELGREVLERCREAGFRIDISYAALANLASVLRAAAHPEEALRYDVQARDGLISTYGDLHPFTLAASINYAADLAACGELAEAIRIGQDTAVKCRSSLGENHPDTLMALANLAIDRGASGERAEAERMLAEVLRRYEQTLTAEHPEARAAEQRTRLTAEIEPY
ncbi:MAG: tetratricopeptide repeat protein [Streptosporangiaceae bacterium]|nr:tetratricopeptide repeat protein [Streptosporangiaceae bacterium]MBV9857575.1 tetratricopeptide repeat protein [Streptosporangiaceae bacterium]